ncbi:MAG: hypothetical protein K2Y32_00285 [Candidatus Obscuribacterales bacterium]|nr:hypothetical protein [Candidatus Obscuribacterales bacterium]
MPEILATMSSQYVTEFGQMVHVLAQEKMSKLMPYVKMTDFSGEDFGYNRFGIVADQEIVQRFQPIQLQDVGYDRRWMAPRYFAVALGIDGKDIDKMGRNPSPELVEACVNALSRRRDKSIYEAGFADVRVGKSAAATTLVTFANDGGQTIDATGGFGLSTLKTIKRNFVDSAVATDVEVNTALTVDGKRIEALMGETALTSFDYNTEKPLVKGSMANAYGMSLIPYASASQDPLLVAASGERNLLALAQEGIVFAKGVINVRIEKRPDMFNSPIQIVAEMAVAALRTEGARVQKIRVAA